MIDNLTQLLYRLENYSPVEVAIELAVIWLVVYFIIRFLRDTGGEGIIKGVVVLLGVGTIFVRILGQDGESFQRLTFLFDKALGFAVFAILVIFQPELRRGMIRLGETSTSLFRASRTELAPMIESVVEACEYNSRNRFGLLIAIVRNVGLAHIVEAGTKINADVSTQLIESIFYPNSALHDLGVVIRGGKLLAAGAQFPLTKRTDIDPQYGSRHRAALGITEESDCLAVVVSEETGNISVAERGALYRMRTIDELRTFLGEHLIPADVTNAAAKGIKVAAPAAGVAVIAAEPQDGNDPVTDRRPTRGGSAHEGVLSGGSGFSSEGLVSTEDAGSSTSGGSSLTSREEGGLAGGGRNQMEVESSATGAAEDEGAEKRRQAS